MQLGGPVWHVSVAGSPIRAILEREAGRQLAGVGDAALGEWRETTRAAFQLRRRLTPREQAAVGPVADIRGTTEAQQRAARVPAAMLGLVPAVVLRQELGREAPG
jgi:hypothetical protein